MPSSFIYAHSFYANNIISGIFLFGAITLLLTISYLGGVDDIDEFDELTKWKGPTVWLPSESHVATSEDHNAENDEIEQNQRQLEL